MGKETGKCGLYANLLGPACGPQAAFGQPCSTLLMGFLSVTFKDAPSGISTIFIQLQLHEKD